MENLIENNYTYRALNDKDEENILSGDLFAKKPVNKDCLIRDAITEVNSHITHGDHQPSCWISTTKKLFIASVKYGLSHDGYSFPRRNIAIIKNSINSQVVFPDSDPINLENLNLKSLEARIVANTFSKAKIGEIRKLVYNLSERKHGIDLSTSGFILKQDGNTSSNNRVINYGIGNQEILILNQLPKEEIMKILTPLEMDIYYACRESYNLHNFSINLFKDLLKQEIDSSLAMTKLSSIQQKLFSDLYIENKNLSDIALLCWNTNSTCDILAVSQYFRQMKRQMISDIINNLFGETIIGNVPILENCIYPVRIGESMCTTSQIVNYYGHALIISPLHYSGRFDGSISVYVELAQRYLDSITYRDDDNNFWLAKDGTYVKFQLNEQGYNSISKALLKTYN